MLTEQEAVAQLNEKISRNIIKPTTKRFLDKIKILQNIILTYENEIKKLEEKKKSIEKDLERSKGAISVLLELAAEDEGMLENLSNNQPTK
jgi:hypothetical protein